MDINRAQRLLERMLSCAKAGGALAAECVWCSYGSRSFSVCDEALEKSHASISDCLGLRILDREHRQGVASLYDIDDHAAAALCEDAFRNARHGAAEDDVVFARTQPTAPAIDLGVYDPDLVAWDPREQIELCMEMSRRARALDRRVRKVRDASIFIGWEESLTINSYGVSCHGRSAAGETGVTLLAEDGEAVEIGGASVDGRSRAALSSRLPVDEAVGHTVRMLHGEPLPTGRYTLALEPEVVASFLGALSELFFASNVCKGLTLLADKMGERVASPVVTLVDDGRLYSGMGTAAYDAECVATQRTVLLDHGRLVSWLSNLQYGKRLGTVSTGNGSRGLSSLPDVDVSNLFVVPGTRSAEELAAVYDDCFCVTELMGLHTVDSVSGDFSLAARGLYRKHGVFRPVSAVTIAGNLCDFLHKIIEVGGDLRFYDRFGGCTMVVDDIAVAGK
ncbi:TldD/PmbA family protein [Pyramidobacter piscolens]|uniref:TldD/PmbA family protein n=1 Tax=Pyramidobacter piscolens TaxID=638849 RepID=UPI00258AEB85|nr:TldD/PmbA family protein [Pyramidobacter piscolens]